MVFVKKISEKKRNLIQKFCFENIKPTTIKTEYKIEESVMQKESQE